MMRIPKTVKVGGFNYSVTITDNFVSGSNNCCGEIDLRAQTIKILPRETDGMNKSFIHELIHAINSFNGNYVEDEKQVDEMANALYMVIQDNPEMFHVKQKGDK
jgi:hypothetical protein